ncbi:phosphoenolpyruvate synthase [Miltoncostaea marina]|uniref:phosphoenolpyruvate synthase n=1 Tax=Miltoncostaea marina TaxID=2843215 RepID=UPI001C3D33A9|nr:phosphoenolpyruvate synthase [Miltoncostaea marina]
MGTTTEATTDAIRDIAALRRGDVAFAGGKGANLGELVAAGVPVPEGFVVGAPAFAAAVRAAGAWAGLAGIVAAADPADPDGLRAAAARARAIVMDVPLPDPLEAAIRRSHAALARRTGDAPVAVRSSATAEDAPGASFAGMNETFLNTVGADAVVEAVRRCWASLYGARTIGYRRSRGIAEEGLAIAVIVQRQVDAAAAGTMFTLDPTTGARDRVVIEAAYGLGEGVVSGSVSPDRFVVDKASGEISERAVGAKGTRVVGLPGGGVARRDTTEEERGRAAVADATARELARHALAIEAHYGEPQDIEWALDADGRLWLLQSRPVTAVGSGGAPAGPGDGGAATVAGLGAAPGRAAGVARVIATLDDGGRLGPGEVLVTHMTAPDWAAVMRRAAAIVTETGGMTCHAAIVARELGVPCVVGAAGATERIRDGEHVVVDATRGRVTAGAAAPSAPSAPARPAPRPAAGGGAAVTGTRVLLNLSEPSRAAAAAALDADGVGLVRAEMMLLEALEGAHPALLIERGMSGRVVDRLADAITAIAGPFAPRPVTYRTHDFRTNEFRGLEGGEAVEPVEANPMIGWRGALRYTRDPALLRLELAAVARVWDAGLANLHVMIPFVRTADELRGCRDLVAASGLLDRRGFELWAMAEVPSVVFNLSRYAALGIRGISIGSNDLTQLMLGADRDSELLAGTFDERDPAVVEAIEGLVRGARRLGLATSICGQAPSVHPEYAEILVRAGIDAISVTPDALDRARRNVAAAERRVLLEAARAGLEAR